jgi:hypothetical protein
MGTEKNERVSESGTTPTVSDDDLYRALASKRRRRLLSALLIEQESTVEELSTMLAGWQSTESGGMATSEDRTDVMIGLRHSDLPVLDESGFVTFDSENGTVEMEHVPDAVRELIHRSVERSYSSRS